MPDLAPCPSTPNCVSSDAEDDHRIEPLELAVSPEDAWQALRDAVEGMPRTKIVNVTDEYLHAEIRTAVFRFVDDLELQLRPGSGTIAVRSASRVGRSDLGVNRRRVERLRARLQDRGVVR
jgi:uncharacterized protein (DUF1499 family)